MNNWLIEAIGILGGFLIALSLTMRNIKYLRIINLAGCLVFGTYGIVIGSLSVSLLNIYSAGANVFFIIKFFTDHARPQAFDILFKNPSTDDYIRRFVFFHAADIKKFFPSFAPDSETGTLKGTECCFILRETIPVSLVAFRREENGVISIILDYAIPAYRDLKSGNFFFESAVSQIALPGTVFSAVAEVPAHASYLRKLGFREVSSDKEGVHFTKEIVI